MVTEVSLQMDPTKDSTVTALAVPGSRKPLQHFLGFVTFYLPFILNYNSMAAPLTALNSINLRFHWSL